MEKFHGFPPVFDLNSKVLILGSFPSVKSRAEGFYYGNKQNRFWRTLCKAFGVPLVNTVDEKKALCKKYGVALWDIVDSCTIVGSMDANIANYGVVDLSVVLNKAKITKILCNGQKAYELTLRAYKGPIPVYKMPSTSPANVRFNQEAWLTQLKGE